MPHQRLQVQAATGAGSQQRGCRPVLNANSTQQAAERQLLCMYVTDVNLVSTHRNKRKTINFIWNELSYKVVQLVVCLVAAHAAQLAHDGDGVSYTQLLVLFPT